MAEIVYNYMQKKCPEKLLGDNDQDPENSIIIHTNFEKSERNPFGILPSDLRNEYFSDEIQSTEMKLTPTLN